MASPAAAPAAAASLEPPPALPKMPKKPRQVKDAAENARRAAQYKEDFADYERQMETHKAFMAKRKRITDKRKRPSDDGARAVQRRQNSAASSSSHASREAERWLAGTAQRRLQEQQARVCALPDAIVQQLRAILAAEALQEPQPPFPPGYERQPWTPSAPRFSEAGQAWIAECVRRDPSYGDYAARERAWTYYKCYHRQWQESRSGPRCKVVRLLGESIYARGQPPDGSLAWSETIGYAGESLTPIAMQNGEWCEKLIFDLEAFMTQHSDKDEWVSVFESIRKLIS